MRRLDWVEGGGDEEEMRGLKRRNSRREVLAIHLDVKDSTCERNASSFLWFWVLKSGILFWLLQ